MRFNGKKKKNRKWFLNSFTTKTCKICLTAGIRLGQLGGDGMESPSTKQQNNTGTFFHTYCYNKNFFLFCSDKSVLNGLFFRAMQTSICCHEKKLNKWDRCLIDT